LTTPSDPGADASGPWVVVGLGNPGPSYAGHRHTVGHRVIAELVARQGSRLRAHKAAQAEVLEGRFELGGPRVVLVVARTYMNVTGTPVAALMRFYKAAPSRLVVVHDELDLPFGALRLKFGGGDNGHNGLRSIRGALGTGDFHRVRLGVGRPPGRRDPADHVLSDYTPAERTELPLQVDRAADAVTALVTRGLADAQQEYND
jgi:peptidyl-tRNA hydrolase, PTH1 family